MIHFGLGDWTQIDSLVIRWPQGDRELFTLDTIDRYYNLVKGQGKTTTHERTPKDALESIFTPDSMLSFTHHEDRFNDFDVQGLLPRYYSRMGPAMALGDLNGDGVLDILMGGGNGQPASWWPGQAVGKELSSSESRAFKEDARYEDVATAIADFDQDGDNDILIASGGNRYPSGDELYALRYYENTGNGKFMRNTDFPEVIRNATCLVTGDFNGNGRIDIFLGSGYKAQEYPMAAGNVIIWNNGNGSSFAPLDNGATADKGWEVDEDPPFKDFICMDGDWKDVNGDGQAELVLGGEWEPIEIWNYTSSGWKLTGASDHKGLVTALHVVNLDDDPEMEIIVGNWGENSLFNASPDQPLVLYYGDFDDNGTIDPVLSYYLDGISYPFVSRDDLTSQLAYLKKILSNYHTYGEMTMEELLTHLPDYKTDSAQVLSSYILDFKNGRWETIPLPPAAQVAPVFAIETVDYDGDDRQDIILAGNSRYNRVKIGEMEANHGVLLRNLGDLNFEAVSPAQSGLNVSGEVRSVKKYISDSGTYILFGVNGAKAETYRVK